MKDKIDVHPFCDVCGKELSKQEKEKNYEYENLEFPFCDDCFNKTIKNIKYIMEV